MAKKVSKKKVAKKKTKEVKDEVSKEAEVKTDVGSDTKESEVSVETTNVENISKEDGEKVTEVTDTKEVDALMEETEGVDVGKTPEEKTNYDRMIEHMEKFITTNPIMKVYKLTLYKVKNTHHYIYQGSMGNKWATLHSNGVDTFYKTSLLRAIKDLDPKSFLAEYFKDKTIR